MAKCLAKDRHDQPCRFKSLADSRFCKKHQYMNDYTDEMLAATIRCNGCMKHYYLQKLCAHGYCNGDTDRLGGACY